jgi:hypothetical protein
MVVILEATAVVEMEAAAEVVANSHRCQLNKELLKINNT